MNVEDKIRHSEELIEKMRQEKPFQHADIKKFYNGTRVKTLTRLSRPGLLPRFPYRHLRPASISGPFGDERIPIGETGQHTTLRVHALSVTEVTLRSLRTKDHLPNVANMRLIWGGMAALSCNLGSGFGAKYHEPSRSGTGKHRPSGTDAGNQQPAFFAELKEVIRLFSIYVKTSITHAKNHLEKDNTISDLAKLLVAAELQVKRREIFGYAEKPEGFLSTGAEQGKAG